MNVFRSTYKRLKPGHRRLNSEIVLRASLACFLFLFAFPAYGQIVSQEVIGAFAAVHDGWSSDEVLLQDELYSKFLVECGRRLPGVDAETCGWALLNARKAGKLAEHPSSKRRRIDAATPRHVAEIAARFMEDKHQVNMDRVVCSPKLRAEFDAIVAKMAPGSDAYDLRKAAFGLRKARRLKPEFVVRIGDWERVISTHKLSKAKKLPESISENPGVYLFRDSTGYLYIGESQNVRTRIREHLDDGDASSLARLLAKEEVDLERVTIEVHAFGPETKAKETRIRRAYESELIASRKPRFNLRP